MLYDNIYGLLRVLIVSTLAYGFLVVMLRVSGKRTLSSMNAFDFVVTVALGSILATVLLSKDILLGEGALGLVLLAVLQFVIARSAQRHRWIEEFVKSDPRLLLLDGALDRDALREERVSRREVEAAVRKSGHGDFAGVAAVVLETDGSLSVISRDKASGRSAFPGAS